MNRILIVEDDESISELLRMNLAAVGYETKTAQDGKEALGIVESEIFDLVLLDVMLPGMDGFELFPYVDKRGMPVIFLTAKTDTASKIHGLKRAEDYIVKPFDILELMVRIDKVLKRRGSAQQVYRIGDIEINEDQRTVRQGGEEVYLKPLEFDVLLMLCKNKNMALSREKLLNTVWGIDFMGETRTVDVHIAQIRKKLRLNIVTLPKVGYRLED